VFTHPTRAVFITGAHKDGGSDVLGMLVAASDAPGYFHHDVGLLYRNWPGHRIR
jgi:hypothetical protein